MAKLGVKEYLQRKKKEIDRETEKAVPRKISKEWLEQALGKADYEYDTESLTKSISEPVWDLLDRGGKRWRPALCLLCCQAVGGREEEAIPFAPLVELIHNGCVTEDTLIWGADGVPRKITEFKKGEEVLSLASNGSLITSPIAETHDNGIKAVFKVRTNNREIFATENHPFLTVSKEQPIRMQITSYGQLLLEMKVRQLGFTVSGFCEKTHPELGRNSEFSLRHMKHALYGYKNCLLPQKAVERIAATLGMGIRKCWKEKKCTYEKAEIKLEWKELKDLKKGDLIVISKEISGEDGVLPEIPETMQGAKDRNSVPKELSMEMSQLCGFILGDGCIDTGGRVVLCIPEAMPGREEYLEIVVKTFGAMPSISKNNITICSKAVAEVFTRLGFAKQALEKEIPEWVFKLPKGHKLAFVKGYLDSDGCVSKNGVVKFECANKKIVVKLKALLDSMGFVTDNIRERRVDNTHFKRRVKKRETKLYAISLYSRNKVLEEIGSEITEYRNRLSAAVQKQVNFRFTEDVPSMPEGISGKIFGFNRIVKIEPAGKKHTYDLQIEETHNYISNSIATHNTLMCDDVEDDSKKRRGKPCTHLIFGKDIAINTGCALYFLPLALLYRNMEGLEAGKLRRIYDLYAEEMLRVSIGQATDIQWHKGKGGKAGEREYLQMVVNKTGVLARFAARLGGILGNASPEQMEALGKFGEALGIGFQIRDDILEITGKEFRQGKGSIGGDIHEGKRTLLVIKTLEEAPEGERKRLLEILDAHPSDRETIEEAIEIIKKHGAIKYAREKAEKAVETAWKELGEKLPESEAKQMLKSLAEYCTERQI